jgi:hypothetical protein
MASVSLRRGAATSESYNVRGAMLPGNNKTPSTTKSGRSIPRQIVVTETGWPTTFGPIGAQRFPVGIGNARAYLQRVTGWAQAQQVVLHIHNIFDDRNGADTSSPFNYHLGLIDDQGNSSQIYLKFAPRSSACPGPLAIYGRGG